MCGNFGFLGKRIYQDDQLLPAQVVEVFRKMGRETEIRGEQAGAAWFWPAAKTTRSYLLAKKS